MVLHSKKTKKMNNFKVGNIFMVKNVMGKLGIDNPDDDFIKALFYPENNANLCQYCFDKEIIWNCCLPFEVLKERSEKNQLRNIHREYLLGRINHNEKYCKEIIILVRKLLFN